MSGSSSLSVIENSALQESVTSRAGGSTNSGVSTPSGLSSRPASAGSAQTAHSKSRPGSEKKGNKPKLTGQQLKDSIESKKAQKKTQSKPRTPSTSETPTTAQPKAGGAQNSRSIAPSAPRSKVTTPRSGPSNAGTPGERPQGPHRQHQKKETLTPFDPYLCLADVQEGLKRGELIEGVLRINPKNYEDAYISAPAGGLDLYVGGIPDRNRALHGDVVVVRVKPQSEWKILEEYIYKYLATHPDECSLFGISPDSQIPHVEHLKITPSEAAVLIGAVGDELAPGESVVLNVAETGQKVEEAEESLSKKRTRRRVRGGKKDKGKHLVSVEGDNVDGACVRVVVPPDELSEDDGLLDKSDDSLVHDLEDELELLENFDNLKVVEKNIGEVLQKGQKKSDRKRNRKNSETKKEPKAAEKKSRPFHRPRKLPFAYNKKETQKLEFDIELILQRPDAGTFLKRTAQVVYLREKKHTRCAVGHIRRCDDREVATKFAHFRPTDRRVPRMYIPVEECPSDFQTRAEDYAKVLFVAKLTQWEKTQEAFGTMLRTLGNEGDIAAETEGMLVENSIDCSEFDEEVLKCLPKTPWSIPEEEFSYRKDFRKQCVFTIDPSTARDLDDAVSCIPLGGGKFRVGVHIADVSHFIPEDTRLDQVASERATSVYLVQKVIPMLPRILCEQLCSLNPGEDRLSFSVEWVISENGDIEEEWFGRSVIRSCVKLAYEHAQSVIDNPGKYDWTEGEIPQIEAPFTTREVCDSITNLQQVATSLRTRRQAYGALRLDLPKIFWTLDKQTGMPTGFKIYELRESNRLIEELMLLANMAVAQRIFTHYPEVALLRNHPPPQELMIQEVAECLASIGIHLDITSSLTLQASLLRYYGSLSSLPRPEGKDYDPETEDLTSVGRAIVMTNLIAKPMLCAKYISSGTKKDPAAFRHYALAVPFYTHFTSPIRRYPDVIVHRLLAASLNYCDPPKFDCQQLHTVAEWCNDRKATAKRVGDKSSEMFLGLFLKTTGPVLSRAVVLSVLDRSMDVVLLNSGLIKRVWMDKLPLASLDHDSNCGIGTLTLTWAPDTDYPVGLTQVLSVFTLIDVRLEPAEDTPMKFNTVLLRPGSFE